MRKKKYSILKSGEEFIVVGDWEHTFHKTRKLAMCRIEKELSGGLDRIVRRIKDDNK